MPNGGNGAVRQRINFSKIPTVIKIPNLIEVQKRSYERFLQMDLLPAERDDVGLQSVFNSVFPITDFRGISQLDFVDYSIGNWECKCGSLRGLHHRRSTCKFCGNTVITDPFKVGDVLCTKCGRFNKNVVTFCNKCGDPVTLQLKYDVTECQERGMTFAAPLKVTIRLTIYEKDAETGHKSIRDIKEQEVYYGEIPLMTENGTFIINGTERVIVSQLHRSPGVFFETNAQKTYFLGKIIPYRGSWVEFEYDTKNILYVRIDRKRKFLGTIFLRALGLKANADILKAFYQVETIALKDRKLYWAVSEGLVGCKLSKAIEHPRTHETIVPAGRKITAVAFKEIQKARVAQVEVAAHDLEGAFCASDIIDTATGEVLLEANNEVTPSILNSILDSSISEVQVFFPERDEVGPIISQTLKRDTLKTPHEALIEMYRKMRPGDPPTLDTATSLFNGMFFDPRKYDFSRVGRLKFNIKQGYYTKLKTRIDDRATEVELEEARNLPAANFYLIVDQEKIFVGKRDGNICSEVVRGCEGTMATDHSEGAVAQLPLDKRTLEPEDFYASIRYLLKLRKNPAGYAADDIDHLGNRRVRAVGELLENQFRIGLVRMERAIKEKMSVYQEMSTAMPHDLINAKPVMAAIREFFGSSQLSQFMDQTNPLSEITHKRRLSALGPGGLSRERAGFEVRDVHPTHYGRICPIETPEGPNIGLISSLSCYARINEYGFIESPYRRVRGGRVVDYVTATNGGDSSWKVGEHIELGEVEKANEELREKKKKLVEHEPYSFYQSAWEEDQHIIALEKGFDIESTYGHVRDLPRSKLAIDIEHNFEPQYVIPRKAQKTVAHLRDALEKADTLILATDEDREGEAIAWHLLKALKVDKQKKLKNIQRIAFHEITQKAIEEALKNPREIDMALVNAQQARRVLDRLVGYKLSPFLWKKLIRGLSAGRVQSVALRLIVDREKEIRAFKPETYWTIIANLLAKGEKEALEALLTKIDDEPIPPPGIKDKNEVEKIIGDLKKSEFKIKEIESRAVERKPSPPFTTSTLQQMAWQNLHFSAKKTMLISQQLYEGIDVKNEGSTGLITYMRTDSFNIAEEALVNAKDFIKNDFGERYASDAPRRYKTKSRTSQEAHEAVRPTNPARMPDSIKPDLTPDQYKLYKLIWQRFIASQMPNAIFEQTSITIKATSPSVKKAYNFQVNGSVLKFDGFLKVYPAKIEEKVLPEIKKDDELKTESIEAKEHQTEPPPRYTEASLIKSLEKFGIGRPSTYAPIMSTITERGYVTKDDKKRFIPSEIGEKVINLLVENFPEIVDINFTASMENDLDDIAENKKNWVSVIKEFYKPFEKNLKEKYETVEKQNLIEPTEDFCEKCGKPMIIRYGRYGKFIACSGFPECKNTKQLPPEQINMVCPLCKEGQVVIRKTRRGRIFYGCSTWPKCTFATWQKPSGTFCPECNSPMVEFRGQNKCSNKDCIFKLARKSKKKELEK